MRDLAKELLLRLYERGLETGKFDMVEIVFPNGDRASLCEELVKAGYASRAEPVGGHRRLAVIADLTEKGIDYCHKHSR